MKKIYLILFSIFMLTFISNAQNQVDALLYSQQYYGISAKSTAMGNALGAVGADMSSLTFNPAGMAFYKKNHFEITPSFMMKTSTGVLNNNSRKDDAFAFTVSDFGIVGAFRRDSKDWKQFSFGISYNRLNDFQQNISIQSPNTTGSILDYYVYNANSPYDDGNNYGDRWFDLREGLAWNTYILNYDSLAGEYYTHITDKGLYGETQSKRIEKKGGGGEYNFSFAGNYKDIVTLGASIGVKSYFYSLNSAYREENFIDVFAASIDIPGDSVQVDPDFFQHNENLSSEGQGVDFKLGIILSPVKFIRIGASVHSIGFLTFSDKLNTNMETKYLTPNQNGSLYEYATPDENFFDWNLRTPMHANAGIAFIIPSAELGNMFTVPMTFSIDYEYVDYSQMNMKSYIFDEYSFDIENSYIQNNMGAAHNIRAGAEFNFGLLKLRGGYQLYSSPYLADDIFKNGRAVYSGGLGFVNSSNSAYIDLAYSYSKYNEVEYLYGAGNSFPNSPIGPINEPTADITNTQHYFKITLGLRF